MNNVMGVPDPTFGVDVDTKSMWDLTLEQMSQAFTAELKTGYVIFYLYTELDLLARLHFSAEELLLYPRRPCPRRRQRRRRRPHSKC